MPTRLFRRLGLNFPPASRIRGQITPWVPSRHSLLKKKRTPVTKLNNLVSPLCGRGAFGAILRASYAIHKSPNCPLPSPSIHPTYPPHSIHLCSSIKPTRLSIPPTYTSFHSIPSSIPTRYPPFPCLHTSPSNAFYPLSICVYILPIPWI